MKQLGRGFKSVMQGGWRRLRPIWRRWQIGRALIALFLTVFLAASVYLIAIAKTSRVENLQATLSQTTNVYDDNGAKAGELYSQKGAYVKYNDISQNMRDAVLSVEDRNFYHEHGFSIRGLARAAVSLVKNRLTGSQAISGGGSTLTQQLVKNAYLSQDQTFKRKAKELFLSMQVEQIYSKNEIFTMYLNNAWFGNGVWGVEDASQKYFGVHASQLTTSQAATLAGMLTNPSGYNPIDNPQRSKLRRNLVLSTMVENKKLTQTQANQAKSAAIVLNDTYDDSGNYKYPWFFDAVIDEAINMYGLSEKDVMNRGYKIYTTLNQTDQTNLQDDYQQNALFSNQDDAQAASVILNAQTGGVRAVIGGREENHTFRGFNRAVQSRRQPGSSIKPIVVYAPALQRGYTINSQLPNHKMNFGTNKYSPNNALNVETGEVPMYSALANSYNIPAVYLLNKMGVNVGYESAQKFGLPVTKKDKNLALALGGLSGGVSPQQMAQAYTAFANDGVMSEAHYITKIVDATGKTIVNNTKATQKRVISSKVADNMTRMMLGTYTNGTGVGASPAGYTIAGKTGTTEDPTNTESEYTSKDSWVIGYTKDIVAASWMGFDSDKKGQWLPIGLTSTIGPLAKTYMEQILPNTDQTSFDVTNPNVTTKSNSSSSSNNWKKFQDNFNNGVDKAVDEAGKAWDTIKGLFNR